MKRDDARALVLEAAATFVAEMDRQGVPHDERAGTCRRAIERGLDRYVSMGEAIVERTAKSPREMAEHIGLLASGLVQAAAAAIAALESMPIEREDLPPMKAEGRYGSPQ